MRLRPTSQQYQTTIDQAAQILAKGLFLLFLLLIIDVVVCIGLLLGGDVSQLSAGQIVVFGVLSIPILGILWKLLRTDPMKWVPMTRRIVWVFTNPLINLLIVPILFELCLFVILFDNQFNIGYSAVSSVIGLFGLWLILFWLIVSFPLLLTLLQHPIWMISTTAISLLIVVVGLVKLNQNVMRDLNEVERIQASLKFFLGDELNSRSLEYWSEYQVVYHPNVPYVGHRSIPFVGDYINISADGIRRTVDLPENKNLSGDVTVHFYGGSTIWGYGARDEHTIPSIVSQILQGEHQVNVKVTNLGEVGYTSFNDLAVFNIQVLQGNIPDIAIFYQGYNDIVESIKRGYIGGPPDTAAPVSIPLPDADTVFDYYTRYVKTVQAMAQANNFRAVFIWQPTWVYKPLTEYEDHYIQNSDVVRAAPVQEYYLEIDPQIETAMTKASIEYFLFMSDFFKDEQETIFMDSVHITEDGNRQVSIAIVDYLIKNNLVGTKE